jgi:hypothetical protein
MRAKLSTVCSRGVLAAPLALARKSKKPRLV